MFHRPSSPMSSRAPLLAAFAVLALVAAAFGSTFSPTPAADAAALHAPCTRARTVARGDYLIRLAGKRWRAVAAYNRLRNPDLIVVGQRLCLAWGARPGAGGHGPALANSVLSRPQVIFPAASPTATPKPAPTNTPAPTAIPVRKVPTPPLPKPTPTTPPAPPAPTTANHLANPWCNASAQFPSGGISQWTVPPSCYGGIYAMPSDGLPSWGYCNWVPEYLHLAQFGNSTRALFLPSHGGYAPRVGATIFFSGGVQGASSDGHYAEVVAVGPGGWVLIAESNFYWRGGGFGRIDFRYIHTGPGVDFRY